jgi:transcriptional regulator of arginine metabolism
MASQKQLSTVARRELVTKIVKQERIRSQQDLVLALRKAGVKVTQATASRDLEELGAVRGPDENGSVRYQLRAGLNQTLNQVPKQLFQNLRSTGNQIVIRTPAGGAQLLAGTIDRAAARGEFPNVLGTIAGDDTVLIICESESQAKSAKAKVNDLFNRGSAKPRRNNGRSR